MRTATKTLSAAIAVVVFICSPAAFAATINYGDFGPDFPPGITIYQDVQESSGTDPGPNPLFGAPSISGDNLDFNPQAFTASATDSTSDITDGQLNFGLRVIDGPNSLVSNGLTSLLISESGDYSLFGAGTAVTSVAAGVSAHIDILEVDGAALASPISLFASTSVVRDLVSDGPVVLAPWSNGLLIEFGPVLIGNNIDFTLGVTAADIVMDDQLIAISEASSVAFIAKKGFTIEPGYNVLTRNSNLTGGAAATTAPVPEPVSAVVLTLAGGLVSFVRRRRGGVRRDG